jgi:hypothetical protein
MDAFSFIFGFYGLMLGLAVTELLGGFAAFARERRIRELEPQTALLALVIFIDICATWLDAWRTLKNASLSFEALLAPILVATCFYLAAALTFPRKSNELDNLAAYYASKKWFAAALLLAAEVLIGITFIGGYQESLAHAPARFWLWQLPYKLALCLSWIALIAVRGRRANLIVLAILILLFCIPYWSNGALPEWVHEHFDRPHQTSPAQVNPS